MTASVAGKSKRTGGRKSHAAYWPPVRSRKERNHIIVALTLAGPGKWKLTTGNGYAPVSMGSYTEFKSVCKQYIHGLDVYVGNLMNPTTGFPWMAEAIDDPDAQVMCAKNEGVVCINIRQGKRWTTIASLARWFPDWPEMDISTMLGHIKAVCVDSGTGIQPSPSALGAALQYRLWKGKKVTRPPNGARKALLENLIGGRVSYPRDGFCLPEVTELDLRSAYASCCYDLPTGTTVWIPEGDNHGGDWLSDRFPSWYARCTIVVPTRLRLGCFAVQVPPGDMRSEKWVYPRDPGTYEAWLWKEEWLDCVAAGCQPTVHEAYAWETISDGLRPWVDEMEALRYAYEANDEPARASMVKRSIVAAIGRFGIAPERRTIVSEQNRRPGDVPLIYKEASFPFSDRYLRIEREENCPAPVHWHSHILMLCRRKLYHRGLEELEDGNEILAENFDALYLAKPSIRPTGKRIGEWKTVSLTPQEGSQTVSIPFARAVVSRQKVSLPGVPRSRRQHFVSAK